MKTIRLFFVVAALSLGAGACASPTGVECDGDVCHNPTSGNHNPTSGNHNPTSGN